MLKTLPSILTAPAQAASGALSGKTVRLDPVAGAGFARLMQQQADLRQTDQRLAQQRQASGRSPEPHPVAPAPPAQPAANRPATADTDADAKPISAAASPAPPTDHGDKPSEDGSPQGAPPRTATGQAAGSDDAGPSQAAGNAADSRSAASQAVNANLARARHAALAAWRPTAADGTAVRAGAMPSGRTLDDGEVTLDPIDTRSYGDPVPAPDSSLSGVAPRPAPTAALAADPTGPGPLAAAQPVVTGDGGSAIKAGAVDITAAGGTHAKSTAGWVAAQQRQRDPNGSTVAYQDSAVGAGSTAEDPDGASSRTLRPAASARSAANPGAADGQSSAAAWAARVTAEAAPTDAALLPAATAAGTATDPATDPGTAPSTATPATVTGAARNRTGAAEVATDRSTPHFDGGPDAADGNPAAPDASAIAAARSTPSQLGGASTTPGGDLAATTALRRSETRPDRSAADPAPSTPAEAVQTAAAAPQRPDAAPQAGVSAAPGAAVPAGTVLGQRVTPATAEAAHSPGAPAGSPETAALAAGHDTGAANGTAAARRTPGLPTEAAPAPTTDPAAPQVEGKAATASLPTPAQAASAAAVSGADIPGGPRRSTQGDRPATAVGDDGAPDTANLASADRDTRRLERPGSGAARLESLAQTGPMTTAANAAVSSSPQSAAGADAQAHANPGDISGTAPAVGGASTAQSTTAAGLANTPAAAAMVEARIAVPVDSPAFAPALGAQVSLFAQGGVQTARLQLNPAEMGPITVQIALDGNAARVDFQADRAATRDLIEASLPTLAGALQDAGLTLTGGGVFQQHPGRQPAPEHSPAAQAPRGLGRDTRPDSGAADPALASRRGTPRGLVDLVA